MAAQPEWILVPAGVCPFGDRARPVPVRALHWSATPLTHRHLGRSGPGADLPVTGLSQPEAVALAAAFGGRLPRSAEWEWMAAGPDRRTYPWGDAPWDAGRAALAPAGLSAPVPVGAYHAGATAHGVLDVAGNVWEWTASPVMGGGFVLRGGSYASPVLYARCTFLNAAPAKLGSPGIGLRVVIDA